MYFQQSIITDASCIGGRCGWAGEERGALEAVEAALVHASAPPLCLDPRPAVGLLAARLHAAPRLFNTPRIRRQARRFSQVCNKWHCCVINERGNGSCYWPFSRRPRTPLIIRHTFISSQSPFLKTSLFHLLEALGTLR